MSMMLLLEGSAKKPKPIFFTYSATVSKTIVEGQQTTLNTICFFPQPFSQGEMLCFTIYLSFLQRRAKTKKTVRTTHMR